jgi:ribosome-associated toxin RatA of RatAB toxin-antitoxin module
MFRVMFRAMFRAMIPTGALLLSLGLPAAALEASAPGPGWETARKSDDLVVFARENGASGTRDIFAVAEFGAGPEAVFRVVTDYAHYADFMPYVKEARVLERKSESRVSVYAHISPPLVDDRDWAIDVTLTSGTAANGGVFKTEWTAIPDAVPARDGVVRVRLNKGTWTLEPLDGGKRTRVTYKVSTHPGGSIPTWMANKSNTVAIPDLFKAVRKRAGGR